MAIEIDGFAVLGAIARHPEAFPSVRAEVVKVAKTFVVKELKDKGLTTPGLRAIAGAVDLANFDLVADAMSDAEIKAMLAKVDKLNAEIKAASPQAQRSHLAALARGAVEPSQKGAPVRMPKAPAAPKPTVERSGNSKAMRARRKV